MNIQTTEYITLQSINPTENRHRAYRISITPIQTTKQLYAVTCSWGRVSRLSQRKHFIFDDTKEAQKFVRSVLNKRKRNSYSIVDKSLSFPKEPLPQYFSTAKLIYHQASLFAEAI